MSLVNDMLRDLDSRRRQAPGQEIGAERLIPAAEFTSEKSGGFQYRKAMLPVLFVLVVLALAVLFVFVMDLPGRTPVAAPMAVISQPGPPVAVQERDPALDSAMMDEISRMADRVRELEARTLSLQLGVLPGQETLSQSVAPSGVQQAQAAINSNLQSPLVSAPVATAAVPEWTARTWDRETPVRTATSTQTEPAQSAAIPAPQSLPAGAQALERSAPVASTLVRNASELSFREADRLQVQQALGLWQGNQRNDALQMLKQFSTQNNEAHQSREMLAKLLLQQGDVLAAMEQVDLGLAIAPDHSGYKKIKARLMMTAGVPRDAAEMLQVRAPSLASDIEYHELLAAAQLAGQLYDEAQLTYQALTASDAQQARWWYGLGAAMDAVGKSFEAAQAYERAVELGGLSSSLMQQSQQRIVAIRQN